MSRDATRALNFSYGMLSVLFIPCFYSIHGTSARGQFLSSSLKITPPVRRLARGTLEGANQRLAREVAENEKMAISRFRWSIRTWQYYL